jgi:hypothetical protein
VPADPDTLSPFPRGDLRAQFVDDTGDFMSRNAGILNAGQSSFFGEHVAMADTASLNLDAHFSRSGLWNLALDDLEIRTGPGNLSRLHRLYADLCCCHEASFEWIFTLGIVFIEWLKSMGRATPK